MPSTMGWETPTTTLWGAEGRRLGRLAAATCRVSAGRKDLGEILADALDAEDAPPVGEGRVRPVGRLGTAAWARAWMRA